MQTRHLASQGLLGWGVLAKIYFFCSSTKMASRYICIELALQLENSIRFKTATKPKEIE